MGEDISQLRGGQSTALPIVKQGSLKKGKGGEEQGGGKLNAAGIRRKPLHEKKKGREKEGRGESLPNKQKVGNNSIFKENVQQGKINKSRSIPAGGCR